MNAHLTMCMYLICINDNYDLLVRYAYQKGEIMGTHLFRDGVEYRPTSFMLRADLKTQIKEHKINMTEVLNAALEAKLLEIGALHE